MEKAHSYQSAWCYTVYGHDTSKYYDPLRENMRLAREQGAAVVLHTNRGSESTVRRYFSGVEDEATVVVHDGAHAEIFPKILRFLTPLSVTARFYFFKDSDSIVTPKELAIMAEWMGSAAPTALIMRDHPLHIAPILAGMFGVTHGTALQVAQSAEASFVRRPPSRYHPHYYDQDWLAKEIYPRIKGDAEVRSSFFYYSREKVKRIPWDGDGYRHIGAQAYKEAEEPREEWDGHLRLYAAGPLSLPYYPRLHFLYGRVRPTLWAAYLLCKLKTFRPVTGGSP